MFDVLDYLVTSLQKKFTTPMSKFQKIKVSDFNEKARNGMFVYEELPCLCKQQEFEELFVYDRYGVWNPVVICKKCGLIQNNPQLTQVEYEKFYSSDDYRYLFDGETVIEDCKERYKENNHIFDDLAPIMKESGLNSILEVGCGGGWHLIPFHKAGYSVTGFDYSPELTKLGISYGLDIRQGSILSMGKVQDKYDVIIINHVIEHFTDFFAYMNLITQKLNKHGVIYAGVPNMDHCVIEQLQIAHTFYFTPRTFLRYMEECGLEKIDFGSCWGSHMYGIFKISQERPSLTNNLKNENSRMKKKLKYGKLRYLLTLILKITGLKKCIRLILKRLKILN